MPASTRCSAGRSVTLLLLGRASRLEPGGRRLGESGEEALRWLKSALWMAARGEVGDVEDAGSDTPWQPAEARPYGVLTAGPARSPHCTRALSRRAVGTPRAGAEDRDPGGCPAHWRSRAVSPVVSGVPGGDSCTRVQCAGVATLPPSARALVVCPDSVSQAPDPGVAGLPDLDWSFMA